MAAEILHAVQANLQLSHLLVVLVGTVAGMVIGALPGLSAVSGVALLLPFTFAMEPAQGLIMLAAVYMAAEYGGSISAILINTPGTSGAACTTLDGTPLTRQGKAQEALYTSLFSGTVGGMIGALVLLFFTPVLARASLLLGPAEIFWIAVAGLALVATLAGRHVVKGLVGVLIGIMLTLVGQDAISGDMRFMFDDYRLVGGIPLIPTLLGLFAVASILGLLERVGDPVAPLTLRKGAIRFVLEKLAGMKCLLLYSGILGTLVGIIPGAGASISAFVAYGEAKRISKHPEQFGHGSYEGVVAPESANNAVVGGALVPLLALGYPGLRFGRHHVRGADRARHHPRTAPVHRARRHRLHLHGRPARDRHRDAADRPGLDPLVEPDRAHPTPGHGAGGAGALDGRHLRARQQPVRRLRAAGDRYHRLSACQAGRADRHDRARPRARQPDGGELSAGGRSSVRSMPARPWPISPRGRSRCC